MITPSRPALSRAIRVALALVAVFGAVACGSDKKASTTTPTTSADAASESTDSSPADSSGSSAAADGDLPALDEQRGAVLSYIVTESAKVGFELDEACVARLLAELSEDDVALLYPLTTDPAAAEGTDITLSPAGEEVGDMIEDCTVKTDDPALVEEAVQYVLDQQGNEAIDEDCVRTTLSQFSTNQLNLLLASEPDTTDPRLTFVAFSLFECIDFESDGSLDVTDTS